MIVNYYTFVVYLHCSKSITDNSSKETYSSNKNIFVQEDSATSDNLLDNVVPSTSRGVLEIVQLNETNSNTEEKN